MDMDIERDKLTECFEYLDDLRESGVTNMFGSPAYLVKDCGLNRKAAYAVFVAWSNTFDGNSSLEQRVTNAIENPQAIR